MSNEVDYHSRKKKIHCKQELIITSLQKFYADRTDADEILQHLQGTSSISLRLIDWFVTNYAKQYNTSYILNAQEFLVYTNYKSQLKAYSKKLEYYLLRSVFLLLASSLIQVLSHSHPLSH